jgi:hypothetical protein
MRRGQDKGKKEKEIRIWGIREGEGKKRAGDRKKDERHRIRGKEGEENWKGKKGGGQVRERKEWVDRIRERKARGTG